MPEELKSIMNLQISDYGRPVVWHMISSKMGGQVRITETYATKEEAIRHAIFEALGLADWDSFPDPSKEYPYDDRDGSLPDLDPVFIVRWEKEIGGYALVTRTEVSDSFEAAAYAMQAVEKLYQKILSKKENK